MITQEIRLAVGLAHLFGLINEELAEMFAIEVGEVEEIIADLEREEAYAKTYNISLDTGNLPVMKLDYSEIRPCVDDYVPITKPEVLQSKQFSDNVLDRIRGKPSTNLADNASPNKWTDPILGLKLDELKSTPTDLSSLSQYKNVEYESGEVYVGEYVDGKRHGKGYQILNCRMDYEGSFKNDKRHGEGKLEDPKQRTFEGEFADDWIKTGKVTFPSKAVFDGSFKYLVPHGRGKFTHPSGISYEGSFEDGIPEDSRAVLAIRDATYVGPIKNGYAEGYGELKTSDGRYYKGSFVKGQLKGKGVFKAPKLFQYKGIFLNNNIHGSGKVTFQDGRTFKGSFVKGKAEDSRGKMKDARGNTTYGTWRAGVKLRDNEE
mmetsp:Transcript_13387/g.25192  ORF Transcript_13387/g.25192 Transcript_13387/m.25192 type:complete len:375 (-) Transcript_13387:1081-2205(-)